MNDPNGAQAEYWSSAAGLKWIEHETALDTAMEGMLALVLAAAEIAENDRVLDIGCGTGASTLAAARSTANGEVVGVDISEPLLDRARRRSVDADIGNVSFLLADAQTHRFPERAFDVLVSRIGMSFFSDTVAALRNLAASMRAGGRMAFVSWGGIEENPWFEIPRVAAESRLGKPPECDPAAPGPTAFQDVDRVAALMKQAGLGAIIARPVEILLTPPGGVVGASKAASRVGPAARVMKSFAGTPSDASAVEEAVAAAFGKFEHGGDVRVPARVNLFSCTV